MEEGKKIKVEELYDKGEIPQDIDIYKSFLTMRDKMNKYDNILCSVSGGADSDVMMDLFCRFCKEKVTFVFFDTGLEYKATHKHLDYLEEKYGVEILRIRAKKSIPITCREYGQPFISKQVSEFVSRLQRHDFKWEDEPYEILIERYPKCSSALKWWCNTKNGVGGTSWFTINRNKWLKEFMILNPPDFKISNKCCNYAKKTPLKDLLKRGNFDLTCCGVRKSEGGVRATAYKSCFSDNREAGKVDEYRPIFWYKDETKKTYEDFFDIVHSDCYTIYGLKRTGCCGCPYSVNILETLDIIEKYEPKLYKAVCNIFKDSYEYTRKYREFCKEQNKLLKEKKEKK